MRVMAAAIAFNEETKIGSVLDRFTAGLVDEIVVINDASTDESLREIQKRNVKAISHETRQGAGAAIRTAIHYARANRFDVLVILGGNDKDRPTEIPRLSKPILEEGYDLVQGSRYLEGGEFGGMPLYRRLTSGFIHPFLFSLAARRRVTDSTNGFRAIRLSLFDDPRINLEQAWLDQYELEPYILFKSITLGYEFREVPVTKIYPSRELGYTKMKPITGWWSILRPIFYLGLRIKK